MFVFVGSIPGNCKEHEELALVPVSVQSHWDQDS